MSDWPICIYPTDSSDHRHCEKIIDALGRRGMAPKVDLTMSVKSQVGLFLGHQPMNNPSLAQTSVCMIHDLSQSHPAWPNFWRYEPWGTFDYGILPNKHWAEMYAGSFISDAVVTLMNKLVDEVAVEDLIRGNTFSIQPNHPFYPKKGVKVLGWPKLDYDEFQLMESKRQDERLSVVYAPSWEHDGRQDSFLKAIADLDIKVYIKQWYSESYNQHLEQVNKMAALHDGRWDNVEILDPKLDIFQVLALCDVLVSEESSTLVEAAMVGAVPIAVTDWKIPDQIPARLPNVPYEFVTKVPEAKLRDEILTLMDPDKLAEEKNRISLVESVKQPSSKPHEDIAEFLANLAHSLETPALIAE